jgi:hypothetical protein
VNSDWIRFQIDCIAAFKRNKKIARRLQGVSGRQLAEYNALQDRYISQAEHLIALSIGEAIR